MCFGIAGTGPTACSSSRWGAARRSSPRSSGASHPATAAANAAGARAPARALGGRGGAATAAPEHVAACSCSRGRVPICMVVLLFCGAGAWRSTRAGCCSPRTSSACCPRAAAPRAWRSAAAAWSGPARPSSPVRPCTALPWPAGCQLPAPAPPSLRALCPATQKLFASAGARGWEPPAHEPGRIAIACVPIPVPSAPSQAPACGTRSSFCRPSWCPSSTAARRWPRPPAPPSCTCTWALTARVSAGGALCWEMEPARPTPHHRRPHAGGRERSGGGALAPPRYAPQTSRASRRRSTTSWWTAGTRASTPSRCGGPPRDGPTRACKSASIEAQAAGRRLRASRAVLWRPRLLQGVARQCGLDAPAALPAAPRAQNVVLISIASMLDPSLAPPGKHVLHAYLPATEPYAVWEGVDRKRCAPGIRVVSCVCFKASAGPEPTYAHTFARREPRPAPRIACGRGSSVTSWRAMGVGGGGIGMERDGRMTQDAWCSGALRRQAVPLLPAVRSVRSERYRQLKEERSQVLWKAVERIIPGAAGRSSHLACALGALNIVQRVAARARSSPARPRPAFLPLVPQTSGSAPS